MFLSDYFKQHLLISGSSLYLLGKLPPWSLVSICNLCEHTDCASEVSGVSSCDSLEYLFSIPFCISW